jgi:riboflavin kinase/FMN adenylyltransferase
VKPVAATIGVFDGVHPGHQFLVARTVEEARRIGGDAVAFTFEPHPAAVLAPERAPLLLTTTAEKIPLLQGLGAQRVEVIPFDRQMADLSPEEFVDQYLLRDRALGHLVIGHDFALGKDRAGDGARLAAIGAGSGFAVTRLPALRREGEVVSSTRIREAVLIGDLERARALLGRHYGGEATVVPGEGRGRTLGFATANLDLPRVKLMPPFGVYAVLISINPRTPRAAALPAVMNYGIRPTFGGGAPAAEAHLLDFEDDLTGRNVAFALVARIRKERRFPDGDALAAQIREDVARARAILGHSGGRQGG